MIVRSGVRSSTARSTRIAVCSAIVIAGLAAPGRPGGGPLAPCPCAAQTGASPYDHFSCRSTYFDEYQFGGGIAVDYLNDAIDAPHAFTVTSGTLSPYDDARFRVYALSGPQFYPVTEMFFPCPAGKPVGRVKVRAAPGSRSVSGRVTVRGNYYYSYVYYRPARRSHVDRRAIITFTYQSATVGPFETQFTLDLPGRS